MKVSWQVERIFVTGGQPLSYSVRGDSPGTLVLLHGGSIDHSVLSWGTCRDKLAERHTVICLDFPGFGRSFPLTQPCTARFLIHCVCQLIEKEITHPVSLLGLSMGGLVAMGCALARPGLVKSLILVNSLGLSRRLAWSPIAWLGGRIPTSHIRLSRFASRSDVRARIALRPVLNRQPSARLVARVRGSLARSELLATGWRSFLSQEATLRGFKTCFQDQLSRIQSPVLQIHGAGDRLIPPWHGIRRGVPFFL